MISTFIRCFLGAGASGIAAGTLAGLAIVAFLKLDASWPTKFFLMVGLLLLVLLIALLDQIKNFLVSILIFTRSSYIVLEKQRLEPDDLRPAREILYEDLEIEKSQKETDRLIGRLAGGFTSMTIVAFGAVCAILSATLILLIFFPNILHFRGYFP